MVQFLSIFFFISSIFVGFFKSYRSFVSLCITGCICYMPLTVTVNTTAECLPTDCNILGDNKKKDTGFAGPSSREV